MICQKNIPFEMHPFPFLWVFCHYIMLILPGTITTTWRRQWRHPPPTSMSPKSSRPAAARPPAIAISERLPCRDSRTLCDPWRGGGTSRLGCRPRPLCPWTDRPYTPDQEQAVPVLPTVVNKQLRFCISVWTLIIFLTQDLQFSVSRTTGRCSRLWTDPILPPTAPCHAEDTCLHTWTADHDNISCKCQTRDTIS